MPRRRRPSMPAVQKGNELMNRRNFIAGAAAAAATAATPPRLAVEGGKPVRETPLNSGFYGSAYYGPEEANELNEVIKKQRPFRRYGPRKKAPQKAATFGEKISRRLQNRFAL